MPEKVIGKRILAGMKDPDETVEESLIGTDLERTEELMGLLIADTMEGIDEVEGTGMVSIVLLQGILWMMPSLPPHGLAKRTVVDPRLDPGLCSLMNRQGE